MRCISEQASQDGPVLTGSVCALVYSVAGAVLLAIAVALPAKGAGAWGLSDLSGTGWRLIEIAAMDDTVAVPEAGTAYRLLFAIDGSVSIVAGCYRATGALTRWDPPGLQFSDFTSTDPACDEPLLAGRYQAELERARSFVYRDGRLQLATMADGSIMEFAPLPAAEATATVAALSVITDNPDALRSIALTTLLNGYASAAGIGVTDAEVAAYLTAMEERLRHHLGDEYEDPAALADDERARAERMRYATASAIMRRWKTNRALYRQYGGRIIYQQFGPEPIDAYRAFLDEAREAGKLRIHDPALAAPFWAYFDDERRHAFMPPGSDDEARAFATPPWRR